MGAQTIAGSLKPLGNIGVPKDMGHGCVARLPGQAQRVEASKTLLDWL